MRWLAGCRRPWIGRDRTTPRASTHSPPFITWEQPLPDHQADLVEHFASLAAETSFSDLPVEAVEAAQQSIYDTLGVSLGARGLERSVSLLVELARETGGRPEASVIGS